MCEQSRDIRAGAGEVVVHTQYVVAFPDQAFAQVRAEETGSAGHEYLRRHGFRYRSHLLAPRLPSMGSGNANQSFRPGPRTLVPKLRPALLHEPAVGIPENLCREPLSVLATVHRRYALLMPLECPDRLADG